MRDILIVDGYNVIFAWSDLKAIAKESLEHARAELRHRLLNYGHHKGYLVILVFDGNYAGVAAPASEERVTPQFYEIYTSGETADAYIEREVFSRKGRYTNVYVVTSDGAEQQQISGFGGLRIPAGELRRDMDLDKREERLHYTGGKIRDGKRVTRNELGSLLDDETAERLERIRLGRQE